MKVSFYSGSSDGLRKMFVAIIATAGGAVQSLAYSGLAKPADSHKTLAGSGLSANQQEEVRILLYGLRRLQSAKAGINRAAAKVGAVQATLDRFGLTVAETEGKSDPDPVPASANGRSKKSDPVPVPVN